MWWGAESTPPATVIATAAPRAVVVDAADGATVALVTGPVSTGRGRVSMASPPSLTAPPSLPGPIGEPPYQP
jgi:hypothetical protein